MSVQSSQRGKSGDSEKSDVVASDEEQSSRHQHSTPRNEGESSSSSEGELGFASPPPNKRRKYNKHDTNDPRIDSLINQVNYISGYLTQIPHYIKSVNQNFQGSQDLISARVSNVQELPGSSQSPYLINPCTETENFNLGDLNTDYDVRRVIPQAKKERLETVSQLQHFDSQAWKGIRYKSILQKYAATPGFVGLKINEELCHFKKSRDYLISAENMLAGLSNAELHRQELLRQGLQELLNWASNNPGELNPTSLFGKVSGLLGPGSPLHKCSEDIMQIICGRRGECIEIRRDRIIKELNSPMLKTALRDIPPSSEYLFSRQVLHPLIQSLGGTQTWLNQPEYIKTKIPSQGKSASNYKPVRKSQWPIISKNTKSDQRVKRNNFQSSRKGNNGRNFTKRNSTNQNVKQE